MNLKGYKYKRTYNKWTGNWEHRLTTTFNGNELFVSLVTLSCCDANWPSWFEGGNNFNAADIRLVLMNMMYDQLNDKRLEIIRRIR